MFIAWDSDIRAGYRCGSDEEDYFGFLREMKKMGERLKPTIEELIQKGYGKRTTRILDQYNWVKFRGRKSYVKKSETSVDRTSLNTWGGP